ncbi:MAG: VWA domain-containing protein, partial [Candidatus Nealsonbacteria bacterium]|nr:VWA domain-containing protein [Candidatus Nealsonbacteria bacterium]
LYASGLHPSSDCYAGVLESALSTNYNRLRNNVLSSRNLEAGKYDGWTGTGAAIGDAAHYLNNGTYARDEAEKVIVLMSDGHANRPSSDGPGYARTMAAYAARLEVKIYTISLGNDADLNLMEDIARITDGTHFDATGSGRATLTARLTEAFEKVAAAIKRVQLVR